MIVEARHNYRLVSRANVHGTHWQRIKLAKTQRQIGYFVALDVLRKAGIAAGTPCTVTLIRIAPRALDDDNLAHAFKSVRDGIADALEINDRDPRVTWRYAQERARPHEYAIVIRIEPKEIQ